MGQSVSVVRWGLWLTLGYDGLHASSAPRSELAHPCNRVISRFVRKQLEKEVLKVATKAGVDRWPADCPWDPAVDLWSNHERQKTRRHSGSPSGSWTCGYCGKMFKNEHYLDLHLERHHLDKAPKDGVCLAEYCDIFDVCERPKVNRKAPPCIDADMAKARRLCDDAVAKCFPLTDATPAVKRLYAELTRHWCHSMDCGIQEERRKEKESALIPVVILLLLIVIICLVIFSVVVCCVDYSDDVLRVLVESKIASTDCAKRLMRTREKMRTTAGRDRTKQI